MVQSSCGQENTEQGKLVSRFLEKARDANTNMPSFYEANKDWLASEVQNYLSNTERDLEEKKAQERADTEARVQQYLATHLTHQAQ